MTVCVGTQGSYKQDSQCAFNVTRGAFVQPLLRKVINITYSECVCVCSLRYPA